MKIRMYAVAASTLTLLAFSSSTWAGGSLFGADSESDLIASSGEKSAGSGSFYGGASIGKSIYRVYRKLHFLNEIILHSLYNIFFNETKVASIRNTSFLHSKSSSGYEY